MKWLLEKSANADPEMRSDLTIKWEGESGLGMEMCIKRHYGEDWTSLVAQEKRIYLQCRRHGFDPWVGKITWRRKWQPTPVFLPEESHRQRILVGYTPWGHRESDTTE